MKKWTLVLVLMSLAAGAVWWQRTPLLAWYYVRGLTGADQTARDAWAKRVAGLDMAVLPRLLNCLDDANSAVCENATAGLLKLAERWDAEDDRCLDLAEDLQQRFDRFSCGGQVGVLEIMADVLRRSPPRAAPPRLARAAGDLLTTTAAMPDLRPQVLDLAGMLVEHVQPGQWRDVCLELALQSFRDAKPKMRIRAVNLLVHLARVADTAFLERVVPLLRDPVPAVRRAAVLAVGPSGEAVPDDVLLPLLHDADAEVCRLVELALRSRGLQESHILLARLISDQRPGERLQVLDHLGAATDLEPGVWLRRLSKDPAPAVRAAAVRAAYYQTHVDLRDRMRQMARQDPSPTVRQLAEYYLNRQPVRRID
jgi:hypothetical protein